MNDSKTNHIRRLSISDDDLCATCDQLEYCPGESSLCALGWPGEFDEHGYYVSCIHYNAAFDAERTYESTDEVVPYCVRFGNPRQCFIDTVVANLDMGEVGFAKELLEQWDELLLVCRSKVVDKPTSVALSEEQRDILRHTASRAANGLYCGDSGDMQVLVLSGLMESAGCKSFVPSEYFKLTALGRKTLKEWI